MMDIYISNIENIIHSCFIISSYRLNIERRTQDIVFIHGQIDFSDTSALDFKEFVEKTDIGIKK